MDIFSFAICVLGILQIERSLQELFIKGLISAAYPPKPKGNADGDASIAVSSATTDSEPSFCRTTNAQPSVPAETSCAVMNTEGPGISHHENAPAALREVGAEFREAIAQGPPSGAQSMKDVTLAINGFRPEIPDSVDRRVSNLIQWCWQHNPWDRPSAEQIVQYVDHDMDLNEAISQATPATMPVSRGSA